MSDAQTTSRELETYLRERAGQQHREEFLDVADWCRKFNRDELEVSEFEQSSIDVIINKTVGYFFFPELFPLLFDAEDFSEDPDDFEPESDFELVSDDFVSDFELSAFELSLLLESDFASLFDFSAA